MTVGISGTGGGFERFCRGETDLSNASRAIDEEEVAICEENGVEYVELQVANDALTVVVNSTNDWATCLTVDELKKIWEPGSTVSSWRDVRASFPDEPLELFGPGTDSGTFDYFTDAINGEEGASRTDYQASEDDNVIVQGVKGTPGGLGYFGFSYFEENQDTLEAVEVDDGSGCVAPSAETAQAGDYTPLARPCSSTRRRRRSSARRSRTSSGTCSRTRRRSQRRRSSSRSTRRRSTRTSQSSTRPPVRDDLRRHSAGRPGRLGDRPEPVEPRLGELVIRASSGSRRSSRS